MTTFTPRFRLLAGLILAGVSAVSVLAPVASADEPIFQPDAWITRSGGPPRGMGVYNLTATDQTIYLSLHGNNLRRAYLRVKNEGNVATPYMLSVICCGESTDSVRYFVGRTDVEITDDVVAGTYETPELAPGQVFVIRIRLLTGPAAPGTFYSRKYIFSAEGGGVPDAARMWVKRV